MTVRWVASALDDAKDRFRKLRGHRDMKQLMAALDKRTRHYPIRRTEGRVASRTRSRHTASFNSERDIAHDRRNTHSFSASCRADAERARMLRWASRMSEQAPS